MLIDAAAVAAGGALGAIARWSLSSGVHRWLGREFPWGTLAVNLLGSFAIGVLAVLLLDRLALAPAMRLGLVAGFLGAFTTFSTFALDTVELLGSGQALRAAMNVALSVVACVLAVVLGMALGRQWTL